MKHRISPVLGILPAVAAAAFLFACSSSSTPTPGGGPTGTGGSTGTPTGTGGATGAGGMSAAKYALTCVGVSSKGTCVTGTDQPCANTCGPNKSGYKNCDCIANTWNCPVCAYPDGLDVSCFKVTATTAACPMDPTDPSGMGLPASGTACTQAACKPCGSKDANAYRDTSGVPKQGFCICVPPADPTSGTPAKYSCTSIKEYPPAAL